MKTYRKFGKDLGCDITLKNGVVKRVSIFKPADLKKKSIMSSTKTVTDPFKSL
jgi:hypothetical protein